MNLTLAGSNSPAVAKLAQLLFSCIDVVHMVSKETYWPVYPTSLDFSSVGNISINVAGDTANVIMSFTAAGSPSLSGSLNFEKLVEQLVTTPNYFSTYNAGTLSGSSVAFGGSYSAITKQKSGVIFVTAEMTGTQSAQTAVSFTLYRDSGGSRVTLGTWSAAPGGLTGFAWAGKLSALDVLPDGNAHQYFIEAIGGGGDTLTVSPNGCSIQAFEIGGPG